jgi:hypothetical protein
MVINGINFKVGDDVIFHRSPMLLKGKIFFNPRTLAQGHIYICHNDPNYNGAMSPNMLEQKYSWLLGCDRDSVNTGYILQDGHLIPGQTDLSFKEMKFSDKLKSLFTFLPATHPWASYFFLKVKPFEHFTQAELASNPGFLKLIGYHPTKMGDQLKIVEVKISRFLKTISDAIGSQIEFLKLDDATIEKVYNTCVAFQNDTFFELGFYEGKDLKQAYKRKNYSKSCESSPLYNSCMTNKKYFKLYTKNKQVKLAYLKSESGIEARCLVWDVDGTFYFDRIYATQDWIVTSLSSKLKAMGYHDIMMARQDKDFFLSIKLDEVEFDEYPYLDTFRFLDFETKTIYAISDYTDWKDGKPDDLPDNCVQLCHTDGTYDDFPFE